ncbi:MAG: hypothetical protein HY913_24205 [Desulfomonile tiedjei]|nr:hypothetical protein [Desulfomonile tiedjei]
MSPKREISARDFVADLRFSGFSNRQLMEKYRLTERELEFIFKKLVAVKAINPSELNERSAPADPALYPEMPSDFRISIRDELDFPLPVYEKDFPDERGLVLNVSTMGLGVKGIEASVGEIKTLVIPAHELFHINLIEVEGQCRWATRESLSGVFSAGFEIINVVSGSLEELQMMIRSIPLEDRVAMRKKL